MQRRSGTAVGVRRKEEGGRGQGAGGRGQGAGVKSLPYLVPSTTAGNSGGEPLPQLSFITGGSSPA
ncbi:hypothetical protein PI95_001295 [Hassallia byssoidea VB512170]|uniref:Uncharacterized protein n=1 Tax=Hassallia byssoidea VB512170 TaxID=1304833 RepID=A0A846H3P3_9CYAN|nr:hypothetical protein [Hassalia byssoidea]NEU71250.1 hypothetical protein [Hassalia byssoidea VB512170]